MFASPAARDATAAAVQPVTPISCPSSTSAEEIVGVNLPALLLTRCPTDQQRKDQMPIHVLTDQYRVQPVLYLMYLMRMTVWSYHWLDHMQIAHSSQHVSAEQVKQVCNKQRLIRGGFGQGAYCQEAEGGILASEDGHANGASDLFVLEQVNARGMGITTTIYKRNAAMCSI